MPSTRTTLSISSYSRFKCNSKWTPEHPTLPIAFSKMRKFDVKLNNPPTSGELQILLYLSRPENGVISAKIEPETGHLSTFLNDTCQLSFPFSRDGSNKFCFYLVPVKAQKGKQILGLNISVQCANNVPTPVLDFQLFHCNHKYESNRTAPSYPLMTTQEYSLRNRREFPVSFQPTTFPIEESRLSNFPTRFQQLFHGEHPNRNVGQWRVIYHAHREPPSVQPTDAHRAVPPSVQQPFEVPVAEEDETQEFENIIALALDLDPQYIFNPCDPGNEDSLENRVLFEYDLPEDRSFDDTADTTNEVLSEYIPGPYDLL